MSPVQQRGLALWAALLSAVVCLAFLPLSRLASVLVLLAMIGVNAARNVTVYVYLRYAAAACTAG